MDLPSRRNGKFKILIELIMQIVQFQDNFQPEFVLFSKITIETGSKNIEFINLKSSYESSRDTYQFVRPRS